MPCLPPAADNTAGRRVCARRRRRRRVMQQRCTQQHTTPATGCTPSSASMQSAALTVSVSIRRVDRVHRDCNSNPEETSPLAESEMPLTPRSRRAAERCWLLARGRPPTPKACAAGPGSTHATCSPAQHTQHLHTALRRAAPHGGTALGQLLQARKTHTHRQTDRQTDKQTERQNERGGGTQAGRGCVKQARTQHVALMKCAYGGGKNGRRAKRTKRLPLLEAHTRTHLCGNAAPTQPLRLPQACAMVCCMQVAMCRSQLNTHAARSCPALSHRPDLTRAMQHASTPTSLQELQWGTPQHG
jgi:hypothetical protein